ncbi:orotidine-5'-phosphate decarboxylase [Salinibacterium sp. SYSU T00001]|uniref:orotidine-5'-phosphate decarboxylase n=1 Tax=Homoserinimonas sedimenticola TaxID=2986805 RepID=UPI002236B5F5|nr:orotidine-5'-phosphate decarboxylase [Salinibacterium sedimenticola]MCW4384349.1 orotidine-5'-phosphate decarboxylase [Salinibacterium sedimenticola]
MNSFGARLQGAVAASGRLCVGIDPHPYLLEAWGLEDSAAGVREFALRVVEATQGHAGVVKPQVAFFERHGAAGYAALEETLVAARAAGLLVIADAKRGDVGTSVEAYGQAWLSPGGSLEADAMTVSAFQGVGSLEGVIELARQSGKGLFVLSATSNPEATVIQRSRSEEGLTVAATIARDVARANQASTDAAGWGSFGLVLGATVALSDYGLEAATLVGTPVLAPGFGHQGARISDLGTLFGPAAESVLVSASRSILAAGPQEIGTAIREHANDIASRA